MIGDWGIDRIRIFGLTALIATALPLSAAQFPIPENAIKQAFGKSRGTFVMIDSASGEISDSDPQSSSKKLPPCSTFKIWNTLIGLECDLVTKADQAFYKWDGEKRLMPEWNKDLTLKESFQFSCVPAYQNLARKIGPDRMASWLEKIGYGDKNISSGIDLFWLPAEGRKHLLISPADQAALVSRLVSDKLPVSEESKAVLKEIMLVKKTEQGSLYGKTGTGSMEGGKYHLAWFVGYVESGGHTHAFACASKGKGLTGKDSRVIVETILEKSGYL